MTSKVSRLPLAPSAGAALILIRGFLFIITALMLALPASADSFSALATVFNNPNFCPNSLPSVSNSPTPVVAAAGCDTSAAIGAAQADATYGHVGALTSVDATGGAGFPNLNNNAAAELDTFITFTGPGTTQIVNGMNIVVDGSAGAFGGSGVGVGFAFDVELNGVDWGINGAALSGTGQFFCTAMGNFICPTPGTTSNFNTSIAGTYTTQPVLVPLNVPVALRIYVATNAGSGDPGSFAGADFSHSLDFPTGVPLFNLPDGYTANDANMFIFDNQFQPPSTSAAPEPATWPAVLIGIGTLAWYRKRRHAQNPG